MPTATAASAAQVDLSGREKAAILLITLGPEKSAMLFKHLKEDEIEALTLQIANTNIILPQAREQVLNEFYEICLAQQYITEGGINYAKTLLEKSLGEDKAFEILQKLGGTLKAKPFDFIRKTDATQILTFIQNEHPQTIALILSYLKPKQAAEVVAELSQERQADVARRIAKMDRTSPDVIKEIERALEKKLSSLLLEDYTMVGGVDSVVNILNEVDRSTEKNIMETLENEDIELAEEIKKKMFVFEDIVILSGRDVQRLYREIPDQKEWAVALKSASQELKDLIFANVSKRLAAMLQEEIDILGPVRRSDVEEAQQKIVNVVRKLQDANEIIIARGGGGDDVIA
ncbi:MAG: flagellar motor switch protein FliG [Clostridiales bacterium]|jgi:flagellar motor switch protein FliG|nr:flagellar motor switch protein FliG [Clostridiales bacterium]